MSRNAPIRFEATFYDGKSSRGQVSVVEAGVVEAGVESPGVAGAAAAGSASDRVAPAASIRLQVRLEDETPPLRFLLSASRVAARLGNTPRRILLEGGASCETLDNTAVDRLLALGERAAGESLRHRLESSAAVALGAVALVAALAGAGAIWGVPFGAGVVASLLPDAVVHQLGRGTLGTLDTLIFSESKLPAERKAALRAAFEPLRQRYRDLPLALEFRSLKAPNAFALPNGQLVMTDELVELAESEAELLAVLAHEIGHVHHRHTLRMALESSTVALLLGTYLGDASQVTVLAAGLPTVYAQSHYSRSHETEADSFGLALLRQLDIPPSTFANILERMVGAERAAAEANAPAALRYLSSHPAASERIERFRATPGGVVPSQD